MRTRILEQSTAIRPFVRHSSAFLEVAVWTSQNKIASLVGATTRQWDNMINMMPSFVKVALAIITSTLLVIHHGLNIAFIKRAFGLNYTSHAVAPINVIPLLVGLVISLSIAFSAFKVVALVCGFDGIHLFFIGMFVFALSGQPTGTVWTVTVFLLGLQNLVTIALVVSFCCLAAALWVRSSVLCTRCVVTLLTSRQGSIARYVKVSNRLNFLALSTKFCRGIHSILVNALSYDVSSQGGTSAAFSGATLDYNCNYTSRMAVAL